MLQGAVELLEKVQNGELRLDRTIEISVTNTAEKKRTLKRLAPNLATIKHLMRLNQVDFRIAIDTRRTKAEKHDAWRRLVDPPQQGRAARGRAQPAAWAS